MVRRIAFLAFPGLTLLDLVGALDALRRLAPMGIDRSVTHRIVGTGQTVVDDTGTALVPDAVYEDLRDVDLLYVPGGPGTRRMMHDQQCVDYVNSFGNGRPVVGASTGALLLGAAGHLKGKRATTHPGAADLLAPLCKEVVPGVPIVEDRNATTSAGGAGSLDLGLWLVERWWGEDARAQVAGAMGHSGPAVRPA